MTTTKWLNPGSDEAIKAGCKCPILDNHHGKGIRDGGVSFWIVDECPLHGLNSPRDRFPASTEGR